LNDTGRRKQVVIKIEIDLEEVIKGSYYMQLKYEKRHRVFCAGSKIQIEAGISALLLHSLITPSRPSNY